MRKKLSLFAIFVFLFAGCKQEGGAINYVYEGDTIHINRFDSALMDYLTKEAEARSSDTSLFDRYPDFMELYITHIVPIEKKAARQETMEELISFFSDSTLFHLYKDVENRFSDTSPIEKELSVACSFFAANLPALKTPQVYFHVSGLNQNVVAGENILSLSIDKYLGEEYPLYKEIFYDYQRKTMLPERAAFDLCMGYLLSEFPYKGNDEVLLNKMLYWGKIRYILSKAFPGKDKPFIMGYTPEELLWCEQNEAGIWKQIVGKNIFTRTIAC